MALVLFRFVRPCRPQRKYKSCCHGQLRSGSWLREHYEFGSRIWHTVNRKHMDIGSHTRPVRVRRSKSVKRQWLRKTCVRQLHIERVMLYMRWYKILPKNCKVRRYKKITRTIPNLKKRLVYSRVFRPDKRVRPMNDLRL